MRIVAFELALIGALKSVPGLQFHRNVKPDQSYFLKSRGSSSFLGAAVRRGNSEHPTLSPKGEWGQPRPARPSCIKQVRTHGMLVITRKPPETPGLAWGGKAKRPSETSTPQTATL